MASLNLIFFSRIRKQVPCIKISSNFSRVCVFVCIREINTWINVWMCLWISMENNKWSNRNLCSNCNRYFFSFTHTATVCSVKNIYFNRTEAEKRIHGCIRSQRSKLHMTKLCPQMSEILSTEQIRIYLGKCNPNNLTFIYIYKCNPILVKLPRTNTIGMFILKETQKSITKN